MNNDHVGRFKMLHDNNKMMGKTNGICNNKTKASISKTRPPIPPPTNTTLNLLRMLHGKKKHKKRTDVKKPPSSFRPLPSSATLPVPSISNNKENISLNNHSTKACDKDDIKGATITSTVSTFPKLHAGITTIASTATILKNKSVDIFGTLITPLDELVESTHSSKRKPNTGTSIDDTKSKKQRKIYHKDESMKGTKATATSTNLSFHPNPHNHTDTIAGIKEKPSQQLEPSIQADNRTPTIPQYRLNKPIISKSTTSTNSNTVKTNIGLQTKKTTIIHRQYPTSFTLIKSETDISKPVSSDEYQPTTTMLLSAPVSCPETSLWSLSSKNNIVHEIPTVNFTSTDHPKGNKSQLRTRISVHVRDEVANGCTDMGMMETTDVDTPTHLDYYTSDDESIHCTDFLCSSSDDELEIVGDKSDSLSSRSSSVMVHLEQGNNVTCQANSLNASDVTQNDVDEDTSVSASVLNMLKKLFGYTSLRDGQEWAIDRCLNRQRSLLVAPTGFGKSLCYTLPAAMMEGVCIVVSPLLSLIQDQIRMLPARLAAVTLSGPMSTARVAATLDDIVRGRIKLLFVSPERHTSASFRRLFRRSWNSEKSIYERYFPEVSLLCVDEAHCMSQWAHNFRPSYLRLQSIIDLIEPRSVLAITATAGPRVIDDICRTLKINNTNTTLETMSTKLNTTAQDPCGVRISRTNRDNIDVKCIFLNTQEERLSKVRLPITES
jgi:DEAD/DEAH box helicase